MTVLQYNEEGEKIGRNEDETAVLQLYLTTVWDLVFLRHEMLDLFRIIVRT